MVVGVPDCGCPVPSISIPSTSIPSIEGSAIASPAVASPAVDSPAVDSPAVGAPAIIGSAKDDAQAPKVAPSAIPDPKATTQPTPVPPSPPVQDDQPKVEPNAVEDLFPADPANDQEASVTEETKETEAKAVETDDTGDLFDSSADAPKDDSFPSSDALPNSDAADAIDPPADARKDEDPASDLDDLFGDSDSAATDQEGAPKSSEPSDAFTPSDEETAPAKESDDLDDLFGSDAPSSEPAVDTLEPASDASEEPSTDEPAPKSEDSIDDLFGSDTPSIESTEESLESDASSPAKKEVDSLDDLFGRAGDTEFRGAEFRIWEDNTGNFSVRGRVSMIYPDRIEILKENGKTATVPMRRLSDPDKLYVRWVVAKLMPSNEVKYVHTQASDTTTSETN